MAAPRKQSGLQGHASEGEKRADVAPLSSPNFEGI